ncbi:hypothetical protein [Paenibacillus humicola]|uniref:hypothetical protein n=1 Tax=Paenibacillus humicola TaxID=3110540 RepID=UPI00237A96C3|nr:hypothetical protein [Paenibacillus humicola]
MAARIRATFPDVLGAREAELKLQALRAQQVEGDGAALTATVDEELLSRAIYLIRQTGGQPEL